jgi:hypothetical protein
MPFLVSCLITAAYWPGISGAATSPRWIIAAVFSSVILFLRQDKITVRLPHVLGLLFVMWSLASFGWSEYQEDTIGAGFCLLAVVSVFLLGSSGDWTRQVYLGCAAGLLICDGFAVAQLCGFHGVLANSVPASLFINKNFYAEISALVAVALLGERLWFAVPTALPGLLLTNSRTALLAVFAALTAMIWKRSRLGAIALAAWGIVLAIAVTTFAGKTGSSEVRLAIWSAVSSILNWHGYGFGTLYESSPQIRELGFHYEHAYNEFLEATFETGYIGTAILVAFCVSLLSRSTGTTEGLVLVALFIECLFGYPLHMPATALLGAFVAGSIARTECHAIGAARARGMALWRSVQAGAAAVTGRVAPCGRW